MKKLVSLLVGAVMACGIVVGSLDGVLTADAASELYWPVPGTLSYKKVDNFHNQNAIDISGADIAGYNVVAAMGGTVKSIFLCDANHWDAPTGDGLHDTHYCHGFGTGIVIQGDDGRVYQYAHMEAGSIPENVYYGAYVSAGQVIGKVGMTGFASGYHLHFGISLENYWNKSGINPYYESYTEVDVHTHEYKSEITTEPTCTETGVLTFNCECGDSYTEEIPAAGHIYTDTVVPPTETEKGYTLHTCSVCGDSYEDSFIEPPVMENGWYYCDALPQGITDEDYIVEYKNNYEMVLKETPGEDWVKTETVIDEWQDTGDVYTSETPLETSDSRVLVKECYYHWCIPGGAMGSEGNYEQTEQFSHYDEIVLPNEYIHETASGDDGGHTYYLLAWEDGNQVYCKSGEQCDGSFGEHDYRCRAWYKHYVYQDREKVELYKYVKESDWTEAPDSEAVSVNVRYKLKQDETVSDGDLPADTKDKPVTDEPEKTDNDKAAPSDDASPDDKDNAVPDEGDKAADDPSATSPEVPDGKEEETPLVLKGDVNLDGAVNVTDISLIAAHVKGIKSLDDETLGDVNGDGAVKVTDLSMVAAQVKGVKEIS